MWFKLYLSGKCQEYSSTHTAIVCLTRLVRQSQQRSSRSRSRHCQLRSPTKDASVSAVLGALSALEALCDNALYKLTPPSTSIFSLNMNVSVDALKQLKFVEIRSLH